MALPEVLERLFGGSASELNALLADTIAEWRVSNLIRIRTKVQKKLEESGLGLDSGVVPPRIASVILERASLEDDELLTEMWANLIVSARNPETRQNVRRLFAQLLGDLDPIDVSVLIALERKRWVDVPMFLTDTNIVVDLEEELQATRAEIETALTNLWRLGLVVQTAGGMALDSGLMTAGPVFSSHHRWTLSSLSDQLLEACGATSNRSA